MKKSNLFLLFIAIQLAFVSCEKEVIQKENPQVLNYVDGVACVDGVLHFDSYEALDRTIEAQKSMTLTQLETWEKGLGFVSSFTAVDKLFRSLNEASTEAEFNSILAQNSHLLKTNGEDVEPIVAVPAYARIINKDGNYFVEGKLFKVTEDVIYSSEEGCIDELNNAVLQGIGKERFDSFNYFGASDLKSVVSGGVCHEGTVIDEKENSEGSRKVKLLVTPYCFKEKDNELGYEMEYCFYCVTVETHTLWKRFGRFVRYNNPHRIRNFHVNMVCPHGGFFDINSTHYIDNLFYNASLSIDFESTADNEMMTKIWRDHAKMGGKAYLRNGLPWSYIPPKINKIEGEVWSNGVPEEQKLVSRYSCSN
jgi:hypothetical protein